MKSFCYLGDRLNASSKSEAAVTARTKTRWIKFRECRKFLQERKFSLKIKREISQSYVISEMLYCRKTWFLQENEMTTLKRTGKAMIRARCEVKLIEKKSSQELMNLLGLVETLNAQAGASGVRWYRGVLRRDNDDVLKSEF